MSDSADLANVRRQLKIKSGVTFRLSKEVKLYKKEAEVQRKKLDGIVAARTEGWELNNNTRLTEEADKMIIDAVTRLDKAVGELKTLIETVREQPGVAQDEEFTKADGILSDAIAASQ